MKISVLIADDHTVVRDGLRALLKDQSDLEVVGSASTGREALELMSHRCADIVLMDIAMPELNGLEAIEKIFAVCPSTGIIILSMYSTSEYIFRAMQTGARGYLLKEAAGLEVAAAIRSVHSGEYYLSRKLPESLLVEYQQQRQLDKIKSPLESLSFREKEVLQLVVEGKSSSEIAGLLDLSVKTVETYRSRLMKKLGVDNLVSLIKFAIQHGLTPPV